MHRMFLIGLVVCLAASPIYADEVFFDCLSNGADISSELPPVVEMITVGVDDVAGDAREAGGPTSWCR